MGMGVMDLAVEIYKDAELKELVENYIEQRDQKKETTTKAAGPCAKSHNTKRDIEDYKQAIKIIVDKTSNIDKLKKMLGWVWACI